MGRGTLWSQVCVCAPVLMKMMMVLTSKAALTDRGCRHPDAIIHSVTLTFISPSCHAAESTSMPHITEGCSVKNSNQLLIKPASPINPEQRECGNNASACQNKSLCQYKWSNYNNNSSRYGLLCTKYSAQQGCKASRYENKYIILHDVYSLTYTIKKVL